MTAALPAFDLNLLPILLALHDARSVSMAAQQLGMSQPGVSAALAKLRTAFGDPLFVRTSRGMEPTPRALALIPAARDVLARIQQGIVETGAFDPATTTHLFSIALSDVGEMVFLPRIVEAMARQAPHASVQSVTLPPAQIERALETGALDLAVGYFPDLKKNNFSSSGCSPITSPASCVPTTRSRAAATPGCRCSSSWNTATPSCGPRAAARSCTSASWSASASAASPRC